MHKKHFSVPEKALSFLLAVLIFSLPVLAQAAQTEDPILDARQAAERDANKSLWFILGCVAPTITLIIAMVIQPTPPQTYLLGKSPEYVAAFSDTYSSNLKRIRTNNALYGCLAGVAAWTAFYVVIFVLLAEESTSSGY